MASDDKRSWTYTPLMMAFIGAVTFCGILGVVAINYGRVTAFDVLQAAFWALVTMAVFRWRWK